jgi:MFS family permease
MPCSPMGASMESINDPTGDHPPTSDNDRNQRLRTIVDGVIVTLATSGLWFVFTHAWDSIDRWDWVPSFIIAFQVYTGIQVMLWRQDDRRLDQQADHPRLRPGQRRILVLVATLISTVVSLALLGHEKAGSSDRGLLVGLSFVVASVVVALVALLSLRQWGWRSRRAFLVWPSVAVGLLPLLLVFVWLPAEAAWSGLEYERAVGFRKAWTETHRDAAEAFRLAFVSSLCFGLVCPATLIGMLVRRSRVPDAVVTALWSGWIAFGVGFFLTAFGAIGPGGLFS